MSIKYRIVKEEDRFYIEAKLGWLCDWQRVNVSPSSSFTKAMERVNFLKNYRKPNSEVVWTDGGPNA